MGDGSIGESYLLSCLLPNGFTVKNLQVNKISNEDKQDKYGYIN
jgi:hypothetical protein